MPHAHGSRLYDTHLPTAGAHPVLIEEVAPDVLCAADVRHKRAAAAAISGIADSQLRSQVIVHLQNSAMVAEDTFICVCTGKRA